MVVYDSALRNTEELSVLRNLKTFRMMIGTVTQQFTLKVNIVFIPVPRACHCKRYGMFKDVACRV